VPQYTAATRAHPTNTASAKKIKTVFLRLVALIRRRHQARSVHAVLRGTDPRSSLLTGRGWQTAGNQVAGWRYKPPAPFRWAGYALRIPRENTILIAD